MRNKSLSKINMRKGRVKRIPENTCRIIKIDEDALFELVYETVIDSMKTYFEILDITAVVSHHGFNPETREYICLIHDEKEKLPGDINVNELTAVIPATTKSMYSPDRYKQMTFDEIREVKNNSMKNK